MPGRQMKTMRRLVSFLGDREVANGILRGIFFGALILAGVHWWTSTSTPPSPPPAYVHRQDLAKPKESIGRIADLRGQRPPEDVRHMADWIAATNDASGSAFILIDKRDARIYVFDADARLTATSRILLGGARGDDTVPGIGDRRI